MMTVQEIEVEKIVIPEGTIRQDIDEEEFANLVTSIKERGLLQPLVVKRAGDNYELIAGLRRYLAIRELGWDRVPAVIYDKGEEDADIAMWEENIVREGITALDEGYYFKRLIDKYNYTVSDIAKRINKSVDYVNERIALTQTDSYTQKAIQERVINFSQAKLLSRVEDVALRRGLLEQTIKEGLTAEQLRSLIKTYTQYRQQGAIQEPKEEVVEVNNKPHHSYYVCPICEQEKEQIESIFLQLCPACYAELMDIIRQMKRNEQK